MKISKGLAFTLSLLLFAIIELLIVIYNFTHPFKDSFSLDSYRVLVADRSVNVSPFTFEIPFTEYVDEVVDHVGEEVASDLMSDIYTTEKIIHPEKFAGINEELEDEIVFGLFKYDDPAEKEDTPKEETLPVDENNKAKIVIIIDDMGISPMHTAEIIGLKAPLTTSFLTYGNAKKETAQKAHENGFEIMLHVPMMPHIEASLAPITLSSDMSDEEIKEKFNEMLERYDGVELFGINNHMGSKFTEDEHAMGLIMEILKERGMYFVDSKTTPKSVGRKVAEEYGVPYIARDVFLDNENTYEYVMNQLLTTEQIASKKGFVVAIGHPRTNTYKALKTWLQHYDKDKYELIHVQDLLKALNKI